MDGIHIQWQTDFLLVVFVILDGLGFVGCQGKLCAVQLSQKYWHFEWWGWN